MAQGNLFSIVAGRLAGQAAGLEGDQLSRISMLSYFMGNPLLSVIAARAMAKRDPDPVKPLDADAKAAAAADAKKILDEAKLAAVAANTAQIKAEDSAKEANAAAEASAESAKQAAASALAAASKK